MHLKEQSVKKQAIGRYYFSIASIQSWKESSNYNKIVCFAGVNDTGEAPEKSNIFANIREY
jgi:predicted ATP-grasp superfamily ATP-dependent carboligase